MQLLGLTAAGRDAYLRHVLGSHVFRITAEVLTIAGRPIQTHPTLLDGQVNIQRQGPVRRTSSLTFYDPDRRLGLDPDSPFGETLFLDRMIRIRHSVFVPNVGTVVATPFIGPVIALSRDGDTIAVECHDKAALAARGRPPLTVRKGTNAVAAIRRIMAATGETAFRLPQSSRRLSKSYTVGWSDSAAPIVVASRIARDQLRMELIYSADGYCTVRPMPLLASVRLDEEHLTSHLQVTYDATANYNVVRVEGTLKPSSGRGPRTTRATETRPEKVAVTAALRPSQALSPERLGRNGAPRYLPLLVQGSEYKRESDAARVANDLLRNAADLTTAGLTTTTIPLMHLDVDDVVGISTDTTTVRVRFSEGSIPLGVAGDMSIGTQRRVSAGRRVNRRSRSS